MGTNNSSDYKPTNLLLQAGALNGLLQDIPAGLNGQVLYAVSNSLPEWRTAQSAVTVGGSRCFFPSLNVLIPGNANALTTTPQIYPQEVRTYSVTAATSPYIYARLYSGALGRTSLPGGNWTFSVYAQTSAIGGTQNISCVIKKRVVMTGMTATYTGAGPTRTLTVTGGSPFVPGDANADKKLATLVETPTQISWITTYVSANQVIVTLTQPAYVNTVGETLSALHYYLFYANTNDLSSTAITEYTITSPQLEFTGLNVTDAITIEYFANSSSNKTISLYFGTGTYTAFCSPIVTIATVTGNEGTVVNADTNGNYNVFGASGAITRGAGSTLTAYAPEYGEISAPATLERNHGYFSTIANTYTLPTVGLVDGDLIELTPIIGSGNAQIDAGAGQTIQNGATNTTSLIVNEGYCAVLRYRVADLIWYATVFEVAAGGANTFLTNSGTALPVAGTVNIYGLGAVRTAATGNTINITCVEWKPQSGGGGIPATLVRGTGYVTSTTQTRTLPATPTVGDEFRFIVYGGTFTLTASAGTQIIIGSTASSIGGTIVSTRSGDAITLVYIFIDGETFWYATSVIGNWTIT